MKVRSIGITDVLDKPAGAVIDSLNPNEEVDATGATQDVPGKGLYREIVRPKGWVLNDDVELVGAQERAAVNIAFFLIDCINVERRFNGVAAFAPWFVSADFLIARAQIETEIVNAGPKFAGSDAVGPLQVSSKEWNAFLANGLELKDPFKDEPNGFDHWLKQIWAAAYRMHADMEAISKEKSKADPQAADGPFQPSNLDVLHAYLLDSPAAAVAIVNAQDDPARNTKTLKEILTGVLTDDQLKAVFAARSAFTGTFDAPKSLNDFIAATEAALNAALKKAIELVAQNVPEELPKLKEADAPWFDEAMKAEAAPTAEPGSLNTILQYFASTSLGRQQNRLPWCGAFAAHCMEVSGNKALIPDGAARAASWKSFGVGIPITPGQVPEGAVVVMAPGPGTGGSGHVAFFSKFVNNGAGIELLGGNQSKSVKHSVFKTSRVAAIRWVETAPTAAEELQAAGPIDPSDMPISQKAFDMLIRFEVTGQKAYERKYIHPIWPRGQSGVTIGIGYDVGHQSVAQLTSDCTGILDNAAIGTLARACGVTGSPASALASSMGGVEVSWEKALDLFRQKGIPRWVGLVKKQLANTELLSKDSLGALVSLTYNRGAGGYSSAKPRFAEMHAIQQLMRDKKFNQIPGQIRAMKRLWPDVAGLRSRRDEEAGLFEAGL